VPGGRRFPLLAPGDTRVRNTSASWCCTVGSRWVALGSAKIAGVQGREAQRRWGAAGWVSFSRGRPNPLTSAGRFCYEPLASYTATRPGSGPMGQTSMDWELLKLVGQWVIAPVVAASLAAYLTGRRFLKEKLWEKKAAMYTDLISALHEMAWSTSELLDAEAEGRKIPDEEVQRLLKQVKDAQRNVRRIADGSLFVVSEKVLKAVERMEQEVKKATYATDDQGFHTGIQQLADEVSAIKACICRVKKIGSIELNARRDHSACVVIGRDRR
jgi:hypothetical protein